MTREVWEIIGAIAGSLSFAFAVYTYLRARAQRVTEEAKTEIYRERLRNLQYSLTAALHSVDAIVQLGKQESTSVEMLQNLARIVRGQLYTSIKQVERQRGYLREWRFGQMVESPEEIEVESPAEADR